jgi:hypothetical protein
MAEDYNSYDEASEKKMVWLESFFSLDQIISKIEACDKDCKSCTLTERNECLLDCKEFIRSIALSLKELFSHLIPVTVIEKVDAEKKVVESFYS